MSSADDAPGVRMIWAQNGNVAGENSMELFASLANEQLSDDTEKMNHYSKEAPALAKALRGR